MIQRLRSRVSALAVVLTVAAAVPSSSNAAPAEALKRISIDNFGQISDAYFRGAQPKGHDYADLAALGVKLVIDLSNEQKTEAQAVQAAGMKFVRIPLTTSAAPPPAAVKQFLALVSDPANQPVYVHCVEGRHRTGVMTAIYRMNVDGWTADRAFDEMKDYKFGMDFLHPEFKKFVFSYHPTTPDAGKAAGTTVVAAVDKPVVAGAAVAGSTVAGGAVVAATEKNAVAGEKAIVPVAAVRTND
jgi:protein tyrosine/serine phosphatase